MVQIISLPQIVYGFLSTEKCQIFVYLNKTKINKILCTLYLFMYSLELIGYLD